MQKGIIIAIDGPVAAGKGTLAPALAERLKGFYLYTGGTYRSLALYCLEHGIDVTDKEAVINALPDVTIDLAHHKVYLNENDVTERIAQADVARATPSVAALPEVRAAMVARQQEIARKHRDAGKIIVIEGRDTATVVFPDAELKVFLTAKPEIRAHRRHEQYLEKGRTDLSYQDVLADLRKRDKEDTERKADPLVAEPQAHGYHVVDNSGLTEDETVQNIIDQLEKMKLL